MNIKKAKEQIKNAMTAYFTKDAHGDYVIPIEKQRPVFLMGPPGIGKTAIMEQVAGEMGVGLLSYSMTHHTRQSALGLPFISHKNYDGLECDISEYTMSEIIASVYDLMENTGVKEGILFLDEINCVSETLAPIMLQFLQYKVFGRHQVPAGWIVVTAGNPPEYNSSVREFDIVTWDRLKRIDVEPDFDVWKEYAYSMGLHPAVLTYLEIRHADFYKIETTVDGKSFVTARGWDDLSQMIKLYELHDLIVDEDLIGQYVQNAKIAKDFSIYYDLFRKYRSQYQIDTILKGQASEEVITRAKEAPFDERLSLIGLLLDGMGTEVREYMAKDANMSELMAILKTFRSQSAAVAEKPYHVLTGLAEKKQKELAAGKKAGSLSRDDLARGKDLITIMTEEAGMIAGENDPDKAFAMVKEDFGRRVQGLKACARETSGKMDNLFAFVETAFDKGQEMLILVTELTANPHTARFINLYGCEAYFRNNKQLLLYERQAEINQVLENLELALD